MPVPINAGQIIFQNALDVKASERCDEESFPTIWLNSPRKAWFWKSKRTAAWHLKIVQDSNPQQGSAW